MIDLTRLLPKLLNATGANPEITEIAAKIAWTRAAGAGLRPNAIPFRLYQKTLIVSVADAIWQKQMQTMGAELVFRINRLLGRDVVDFIEFRIDPATVDRATRPLGYLQRVCSTPELGVMRARAIPVPRPFQARNRRYALNV